ncbi:L-seryl-tRNA(Sec) selenium transferase [Oceaniferula flava]|uniref:L-seryl-tRNA(Sec) selenium transferase n=1 Tax=Oceaniferula flava TaxID=2800421 RepID=UPI002867D2DF|nr:L-seryl-tRNA(Sec) selenium transferase [Oceaniferula flavus]
MPNPKQSLRELPAVEILVKALCLQCPLPRALVTTFVQRELYQWRQKILSGATPSRVEIEKEIAASLKTFAASRLQPVINATGVIIHTNLGRSPLGREAANTLTEIATGYCNLEFNLPDGARGKRAGYLETALASLLEAEAATAVNNCAAALVLTLRHLCVGDKNEVIVSRSELVEIGGGFRIPEILETSGAKLVEVGATNKTNLNDYAKAITANTAMILKVHRSNFYIGGFTEEPEVSDLAKLAHEHQLPLVEDIGSGAMMNTDELAPIDHEPTPQQALRNGIDLVCFSGDKLLGGPQSGIIAGNKELVAGIKKEPFFRAVRCDKLILTVLQECIDTYLANKSSGGTFGVPALEFISENVATLRERAEQIISRLPGSAQSCCEVVETIARTGGGTMPKSEIPSVAIAISPTKISVNRLATLLRTGDRAIVGVVVESQLRLDLRTVFAHQDDCLVEALEQVL